MEEHKDVWLQLHEKLDGYWDTMILSIPQITISVIIICIFSLVAIFAGKIVRRITKKKAQNNLVANYLVRLIKVVLIFVGILLALSALNFGNIAGGLLAGAGVGAIALGFAFKELGENFLAGMILVFNRPFSLGDTITVQNIMGKVISLRFRTTIIKTFDGKDVYVPNGFLIRNEVYNHTQDGFLRHEFNLQLPENADFDKVSSIICKEVTKHPEVMKDEDTQVLIEDFSGDKIVAKIQFWTQTKDYKIAAAKVRSEIMWNVKQAVKEYVQMISQDKKNAA